MQVHNVNIINPKTGQPFLDKSKQPLNVKSHVLTPVVRFSYPYLATPRSNKKKNEQGVEYEESKSYEFTGATELENPSDVVYLGQFAPQSPWANEIVPSELLPVLLLMEIVRNAKWPSGIPGATLAFKRGIANAANPGVLDLAKNPTWANRWVFNMRSKNKPVSCADPMGNTMVDLRAIYAGMYGWAWVGCYTFDNQSNGTHLSLQTLQKLYDGEPLVQQNNAEDDFREVQRGVMPASVIVPVNSFAGGVPAAPGGWTPPAAGYGVPGPPSGPQPVQQWQAPPAAPAPQQMQQAVAQAQQWQPPVQQVAPQYVPQPAGFLPPPAQQYVPPQQPVAQGLPGQVLYPDGVWRYPQQQPQTHGM